jgi:hypothetical protein
LVFAYLAASIFVGAISTIYTNKIMKKAASIMFARMM